MHNRKPKKQTEHPTPSHQEIPPLETRASKIERMAHYFLKLSQDELRDILMLVNRHQELIHLFLNE